MHKVTVWARTPGNSPRLVRCEKQPQHRLVFLSKPVWLEQRGVGLPARPMVGPGVTYRKKANAKRKRRR